MSPAPQEPSDEPVGRVSGRWSGPSGEGGFPPELVVASRNPGKIREIRRICSDWRVRWFTADDDPRGWPEVEETGRSYLENAALKARAVAAATGVPAVADDSGIEVDALEAGPGIHSARYAGAGATDAENLDRLIEAIRDVPPTGRTARYRCVALVAWPGEWLAYAEAACEGSLILEPRGSGGFGYDPIFIPRADFRTMAELTPEEKDAISHRGKAFRELGRVLREGRRAPR